MNLFLLYWTGEFHINSDEEKGTVCPPGPVPDKHNSSTPGEKVDLLSQATSKSENMETLDTKQLLDDVPKMKEELFAYDVNWTTYDKVKIIAHIFQF